MVKNITLGKGPMIYILITGIFQGTDNYPDLERFNEENSLEMICCLYCLDKDLPEIIC